MTNNGKDMNALHIVKTSDGARWAALQAAELAKHGVEVHVAVPSLEGSAIPMWIDAGATIHQLDCSLPVRSPQRWPEAARAIRNLVDEIAPNIIHSHFVTTTLAIRRALGRHHHIPRSSRCPGHYILNIGSTVRWMSDLPELTTTGFPPAGTRGSYIGGLAFKTIACTSRTMGRGLSRHRRSANRHHFWSAMVSAMTRKSLGTSTTPIHRNAIWGSSKG